MIDKRADHPQRAAIVDNDRFRAASWSRQPASIAANTTSSGRSNATPDTTWRLAAPLTATLCATLEARIRRTNPAATDVSGPTVTDPLCPCSDG